MKLAFWGHCFWNRFWFQGAYYCFSWSRDFSVGASSLANQMWAIDGYCMTSQYSSVLYYVLWSPRCKIHYILWTLKKQNVWLSKHIHLQSTIPVTSPFSPTNSKPKAGHVPYPTFVLVQWTHWSSQVPAPWFADWKKRNRKTSQASSSFLPLVRLVRLTCLTYKPQGLKNFICLQVLCTGTQTDHFIPQWWAWHYQPRTAKGYEHPRKWSPPQRTRHEDAAKQFWGCFWRCLGSPWRSPNSQWLVVSWRIGLFWVSGWWLLNSLRWSNCPLLRDMLFIFRPRWVPIAVSSESLSNASMFPLSILGLSSEKHQWSGCRQLAIVVRPEQLWSQVSLELGQSHYPTGFGHAPCCMHFLEPHPLYSIIQVTN